MLKKLIKFYYENSQEFERQPHLYVTDIARCPRAVYFSFKTDERIPFDDVMSRVFDRGSETHKNLLSVLYELGVLEDSEVRIPENNLVSGRVDGILKIDNERYLLEIKTIKDFGFQKLIEQGPIKAHIDQIQLYLYFLKLKKGFLLYENKDNQILKEYSVSLSLPYAEKLIFKLKRLKFLIDNDILPEKTKETWQCKNCPFREICKKV